MKTQEKKLKELTKQELQNEIDNLSKKSKKYYNLSNVLIYLTLIPTGIAFTIAQIFFIPGLVLTLVFGSIFSLGCYNIYKNYKTEEKMKCVQKELNSRSEKSYTQLAMDDILKETYKPELVKKSNVQNFEKENNNDLEL